MPCTTDPDPTADPPVVGVPAGCVPSHKTLFIPNVTTDVGLSPPYNSLFTFFGQFFDHGVDQTVKSGATVFVPLKADDPLVTLGPDGKPGTGDEVPGRARRFMVLTRAQNQPGPDGILGDDPTRRGRERRRHPERQQHRLARGSTRARPTPRTPRTRCSCASTTLTSAASRVATGKLLGGLVPRPTVPDGSPDGTHDGIGTWAAVKKQAAEKLGLLLEDKDVTNIPMLATDPYGKFIPGPNGLPQYVHQRRRHWSRATSPTRSPVPANVRALRHAVPDRHRAQRRPVARRTRTTTRQRRRWHRSPTRTHTASADFASQPPGTYDDEMLERPLHLR